jgi:transcriptional regulator with XRE-family HTH domain
MGLDTGRLRVVAAEATPELQVRPDGRRRAKSQRSGPAASQGRSSGEATQPAQTEPPSATRAAAGENTDGFTTPGPYLKAQRKRRGMSLDQLAAATKIPRPQLELLEADRYDELPGMVFTKGFLRCCARALELDPDAVLGLLYERERTQLRKRRREGLPDGKPTSNARGPARPGAAGAIQARIAQWLAQLPSARILMWVVVALLVALVVFIAFTLASGQAHTMTIRS